MAARCNGWSAKRHRAATVRAEAQQLAGTCLCLGDLVRRPSWMRILSCIENSGFESLYLYSPIEILSRLYSSLWLTASRVRSTTSWRSWAWSTKMRRVYPHNPQAKTKSTNWRKSTGSMGKNKYSPSSMVWMTPEKPQYTSNCQVSIPNTSMRLPRRPSILPKMRKAKRS